MDRLQFFPVPRKLLGRRLFIALVAALLSMTTSSFGEPPTKRYLRGMLSFFSLTPFSSAGTA